MCVLGQHSIKQMQICFLIKRKREKLAKLTFLWYDILMEKGSLHRNGMAAIPKTSAINNTAPRLRILIFFFLKITFLFYFWHYFFAQSFFGLNSQ